MKPGSKAKCRVENPNAVWLTDITYIETDEGYLYAAGVLDLGTRKIVGFAMADHMRTELTLTALNMAVLQEQPEPGLMHHSDRGSQYTSDAYQQLVRDAGMIASMSRIGNCLDNAPMESFWATLKRECADQSFHHAMKLALQYSRMSWVFTIGADGIPHCDTMRQYHVPLETLYHSTKSGYCQHGFDGYLHYRKTACGSVPY